MIRVAVWALTSAFLVACGDETAPTATLARPVFLTIEADARPSNVLSAEVRATVTGADSLRVVVERDNGTLEGRTPSVVPADGLARVLVLGLRPDQAYRFQVEGFRGGQPTRGPSIPFTTGILPSDLPSFTASGSEPRPGFVIFAAGKYVVAIDNTGRVAWYHRFEGGAGLNFMALPNGHYAARPVLPGPDRDRWVELTPGGDIVRTLGCARGLVPRLHDLILQPDGSHWILCDESRFIDLTDSGGVRDARVTATVVQKVSASGGLLFEWNPFDHFSITDLDSASRSLPSVNWTHGNALELDEDGNLVVSFRSLSELTGIDTRTGQVRWRLGGSRNQFTFVNTAAPPFARQHGLRLGPGGVLTLLDNAGTPGASRAEIYRIDPVNKVATLMRSLEPLAPVVAELGGTTQILPAGHLLVSYGTAGRVEEYDATGTRVWQIEGNAGYIFRAQRVRSLYTPGVAER